MQNRVAVIEQNPERSGHAFGARAVAVFAHFVARVLGDGLDVRARIARTHHEIIGQNRLAAHVQNGNVERLDVVGGLTNNGGFAPGFGFFEVFDFDGWVSCFYLDVLPAPPFRGANGKGLAVLYACAPVQVSNIE